MGKLIRRSIYQCLLATSLALQTTAQQSMNGKSPSLSSDGVIVSKKGRSQGERAWTKCAPKGFGLSFELPGDPVQRPYPVPKELKSEILHATAFDYIDDGV